MMNILQSHVSSDIDCEDTISEYYTDIYTHQSLIPYLLLYAVLHVHVI